MESPLVNLILVLQARELVPISDQDHVDKTISQCLTCHHFLTTILMHALCFARIGFATFSNSKMRTPNTTESHLATMNTVSQWTAPEYPLSLNRTEIQQRTRRLNSVGIKPQERNLRILKSAREGFPSDGILFVVWRFELWSNRDSNLSWLGQGWTPSESPRDDVFFDSGTLHLVKIQRRCSWVDPIASSCREPARWWSRCSQNRLGLH